jgi:hypothetical protein
MGGIGFQILVGGCLIVTEDELKAESGPAHAHVLSAVKSLIVIVGLFLSTPAWSQTKVYTNADLGHPLSPNRATVTAEQLASLAAHQFRVPRTFDGPTGVTSGLQATMGPFTDYQNTILPRRLDGTLLSDAPWVAYAPGPFYAPVYYPPSVPYATTGSYGGVHPGRRSHGRAAAGSRPAGRPTRGR